jgi:2,3-bisphosphoglycerate-independent phosphoglycerate mutase
MVVFYDSLQKLPMTINQKVLLIIMDGLGVAPNSKGNAVTLAKPKTLTSLWSTNPHTYLLASAEAVGLPENTKGNSEVGHLNIGAGRVINQNLPRINKTVNSGSYINNPTLWDSLKHVIKNKSKINLMGCLSDGSVHAHIDHFKATVDFFVKNGFTGDLLVHAFTDGRDRPPQSAKKYLEEMDRYLKEVGLGRIATVVGRSYAMDRNGTWDRTQKAYRLLTEGKGTVATNWAQAVDLSYQMDTTDEFIEPAIIKSTEGNSYIEDGDAVIFMNFRADRAIQLAEAFIDTQFSNFTVSHFDKLFFAGMVEYRKGQPEHVIIPKEYINLPLGKVISAYGLRQLRIAESEKFPHVTYFFNGGMSLKYEGEDRIEIPSPNVATYDLQPEMSLPVLLDVLNSRIAQDMYDLIVLNLANPDMVGHTGNIEASIKAVKAVDAAVDQLVKKFTARGGVVLLTADHGNVEEVINLETGQIDTEHSINPVPFIVVGKENTIRTLPYGALKDIAPTILDIMGIPEPTEMTGRSLLPTL